MIYLHIKIIGAACLVSKVVLKQKPCPDNVNSKGEGGLLGLVCSGTWRCLGQFYCNKYQVLWMLGFVDAIPIVAYHGIDDSQRRSSTHVKLFASEMKYWHDSGFKVISMSDLRYDQITNYMYIRNNQLTIHLLST